MSRASVEALALALSNGQSNTAQITRLYDDLVFDLGQREILTNIALIQTVSGTATYNFPAAAIRLLTVFFNDRELYHTTLQEIESVNAQWRSQSGSPIAYLMEDVSKRQFTLYPTPNVNSGSVAGGNFGSGFITNAISVIYTEDVADLPTVFELPMAVEIVTRELLHNSDHIDPTGSQAFKELSNLLLSLVL